MNHTLHSLLMEYGCPDPDAVSQQTFSECFLSVQQLRDHLLLLGNILYEDLEQHIYVASIRTGFLKLGIAVVAMQLEDQKLYAAGYAREGLIKQHLLAKAFKRIEGALYGK